ncbi:phage terminase large subunit [Arthrobacter sp. VKM Ac-2550]|uniref:phage terminase large subunit n=1 Tax=Crystallibacter permensis TaxID=1938888 RepID=UPI002227DACF|nr:phage terminase large subunit [Arthrobacter sp. VKM Ac-2550]
MWESVARMFEPVEPKWATPGDLAKATNPKTIQTPALDLIDAALVEAFNTPDSRLIISMAPQEGKSVRVANDFPIWALTQNPDLRIVTASYAQGLANRNGRAIRNRITSNPDIGLTIANDNGSVSEWQVAGHEGGVLSVGIGAGVTGRPSDMMIIDDPIKDRKEADSEVYRDNVWDWWTDAASARLAPGAPVVVILTRWHQDDLAGRLLDRDKAAGWKFLNIPAQADHRPDKGETDPLGRQPGEFMVSARGRTQMQWENRKATAGPRTWASLYQGRPSPDEGGVFPAEWARYTQPIWIDHADGRHTVPGMERPDQELVQSWDFTFKDKQSSDYVVGQVWLRVGTKGYLLDMVRERLNFNASVEAVKTMSAKWPQAVAKFIEDKANGPAIINALQSTLVGLIPIEPEGSKTARANAVSPLVFSGNVVLPTADLLPNVEELVEEAKNFPNGSHDDTIDAMSQAVNRLLLMPLTAGIGDVVEPDVYDMQNANGWSISPY